MAFNIPSRPSSVLEERGSFECSKNPKQSLLQVFKRKYDRFLEALFSFKDWIIQSLGDHFEKLGFCIYDNPWQFILYPTIICSILSLGFLHRVPELDMELLYGLPGTPSSTAAEQLTLAFPLERLNYVFAVSEDGSGLFSHSAFKQLQQLWNRIERLHVPSSLTGLAEISGDTTVRDWLLKKSPSQIFEDNNATEYTQQYITLKDVCVRDGFGECTVMNPLDLYGSERLWGTPLRVIDYPNFTNLRTKKAFRLDSLLGGTEKINFGSSTTVLNATAVLFRINLSGGEWDVPKSSTWEEALITLITYTKVPGLKLFVRAERSINDELSNSSQLRGSDLLMLITASVFVTFFTVAMNSSRDPYRSKWLPALIGVGTTILAYGGGVGIWHLLGMHHVPPAEATPFMILAICVDDVFVLMNAYSLTYIHSQDPRRRIALCLRDAGISVTITTLTNIVAFGVGAASVYYAIYVFCVLTCSGLIAGYLLCLTVFMGTLCIAAKYEQENTMSEVVKRKQTAIPDNETERGRETSTDHDDSNLERISELCDENASSKQEQVEMTQLNNATTLAIGTRAVYEQILGRSESQPLWIGSRTIDNQLEVSLTNDARFGTGPPSSLLSFSQPVSPRHAGPFHQPPPSVQTIGPFGYGINSFEESLTIDEGSNLWPVNPVYENEEVKPSRRAISQPVNKLSENSTSQTILKRIRKPNGRAESQPVDFGRFHDSDEQNFSFYSPTLAPNLLHRGGLTLETEIRSPSRDGKEKKKGTFGENRIELEDGFYSMEELDNHLVVAERVASRFMVVVNEGQQCISLDGKLCCSRNSGKTINRAAAAAREKALANHSNLELCREDYYDKDGNLQIKFNLSVVPRLLQSNDKILPFENIDFKEPKGTVGRIPRCTFMYCYGPFLTRPLVKFFILTCFLLGLIFCTLGTSQLDTGLQLRDVTPYDSYLRDFYEIRESLFSSYGDECIVFFPGSATEWWDVKVQDAILKMSDDLSGSDNVVFVLNGFEDFINDYRDRGTIRNGTEEQNFMEGLNIWLKSPRGIMLSSHFSIKNEKLRAIKLHYWMRFIDNTNISIHWIMEVRRLLAIAKESGGPLGYVYTPLSIHWESDVTILRATMTNMGVALLAMAGVALLLIPDLRSALMVLMIIVMIDIYVIGIMPVIDLKLNMLTMVNLVLSIGFAVDYTAHITHCFSHCKGKTRDHRMLETLVLMGLPVTNGMLSTYGAVGVLSLSHKYILVVVFKMMTVVLVFAFLHGVVLMPVILSYIGPFNPRELEILKIQDGKLKESWTADGITGNLIKHPSHHSHKRKQQIWQSMSQNSFK